MRSLLLTLVLSMPVLCQVWEPDGTQIRIQRPGPWPGKLDYAAATLGFWSPRLSRPAAHILMSRYPPMPAFLGWGRERSLERVADQGHISELASPEGLDLRRESLGYWKGAAYALGTRRHPAADRADSPSQRRSRPVELWVSRDFRTWQFLARHDPRYPGDYLRILLPLEQDRFLGSVWSNPDGLVIFQRQGNGALIQQGLVADCPPDPWLCRSPKGIVAFDRRDIENGQYQVLDNGDAHLLRRGRLELPRQGGIQLLATLVRPDGNLLVVIGPSPRGNMTPVSLAYDSNVRSGSGKMALGLLNAKAWREGYENQAEAQRQWIVLDPATGQQTTVPPPAGFPEKLSEDMQELQFKDSGHLEW